MEDPRQGNEEGTEGASTQKTRATAFPTMATGERHADDTPSDTDGSEDGTQRKENGVTDGTARSTDAMADNISDDEAILAEQHAEHSKHANMRALIMILLFGIIAIAIVFAIALATGNVGSSSTNAATGSDTVGMKSDGAAGNATENEMGNTQGTNATITTTDSTCSDGGNENASGCDGKADGTHGYEGLSDRQAALLDEVGTDTVLQGIEQGRTFVALFGYASCPDCKAAAPLLLDAAMDAGVSQVLYVDTRANPAWESNTDIDGYDELVSVMGDRFSTDDDGKPHMQVPFVAFVRNGTIVSSVEGDDGLSKADSVQGDAIGQELIGKYEAGFKAMLGTSQSS